MWQDLKTFARNTWWVPLAAAVYVYADGCCQRTDMPRAYEIGRKVATDGYPAQAVPYTRDDRLQREMYRGWRDAAADPEAKPKDEPKGISR